MTEQAGLIRSVFYFDTMLMPKIITFIYWLFLLIGLIGSIGIMIEENVIAGLIALPLMAVGIRLWCEFFIVLFKINENIQKIADRDI